jgi:hypothetical protein
MFVIKSMATNTNAATAKEKYADRIAIFESGRLVGIIRPFYQSHWFRQPMRGLLRSFRNTDSSRITAKLFQWPSGRT